MIFHYAEIFFTLHNVLKHLPTEMNYKKLKQLTSCHNEFCFISIQVTQVYTVHSAQHRSIVIWSQLLFFWALSFCVSLLFVRNGVSGNQVILPVHL